MQAELSLLQRAAIQPLARLDKNTLTVSRLEAALLNLWPRNTAESWDKTGLLVGDPNTSIEGIALALDPTLAAIKEAKRLGANVLITHHPVYLEAQEGFYPAGKGVSHVQAAIYEAIKQGLALMCFHTALDVSLEARKALPNLLYLEYRGILEPLDEFPHLGYGQVCTPYECDKPLSLEHLAARCLASFGRMPRVWGRPNTRIETVVTTTGSAGSMASLCLDRGIDCLICGEIKYHNALEAQELGLCIIDLGHDVSELPLVDVMADTLRACGLEDARVIILDQSNNWTCPDAYRL